MLKKISEFENNPENANNAYVLQLLETYNKNDVFGPYESEIELKESALDASQRDRSKLNESDHTESPLPRSTSSNQAATPFISTYIQCYHLKN